MQVEVAFSRGSGEDARKNFCLEQLACARGWSDRRAAEGEYVVVEHLRSEVAIPAAGAEQMLPREVKSKNHAGSARADYRCEAQSATVKSHLTSRSIRFLHFSNHIPADPTDRSTRHRRCRCCMLRFGGERIRPSRCCCCGCSGGWTDANTNRIWRKRSCFCKGRTLAASHNCLINPSRLDPTLCFIVSLQLDQNSIDLRLIRRRAVGLKQLRANGGVRCFITNRRFRGWNSRSSWKRQTPLCTRHKTTQDRQRDGIRVR
jgi:hypothetical protein